MATTKFTLLEGVWTQVATADAIFQNLGNKVIHVTESATAPTDSSDFKLIEPLEIYEFNPTTGLNLYAKSIEGTSAVSVDGVGATLVEGEVTINSTTPVNVLESAPTIIGNASAAITAVSSTVTLTHKSEVRNIGLNTVFLAEGSGTAVAATDFPLYPDETITLKAGTFDAVCGAALTSTLAILKVS